MKLKGLSIVIFILLSFQVKAQSTSIIVSNSKESPGEVINIKWLAEDIIYKEGVNIYRKQEGTPFWEKLNAEPILRGNYEIPPAIFEQDSSMEGYVSMAAEMKSEELVGLAKAFMLLKTVYSNHFALYLGIQFNDSSLQQGIEYRYMVKKILGNKEVFEAISATITPGEFTPDSAPKGVRAEGKNKKVHIWWEVENERFHSINVYRYSNYDTTPKKLNPLPIVLSERPGPDGKIGYPEVYFTDREVKNDTNYFYSLAGIDFFGRETAYSDFVMASPKNRTPPPPPDMEKPKINLLEVDLFWTPNDIKRVVGYNIYRTKSIYAPFERITNDLLSPLAVRYHDKVEKPGNYYYYVAAVTKNGIEGKSNMVMAEFLDIYPPPTPQNLTAVADSGQIALTWNSVEDEQLEGYRLYRTIDVNNKNFYALMNAHPIKDTTFVDSLPFNAKNRFFYVVVSVDSSLNMSKHSEPASAIMPDVVPPDVPFIKSVSVIDGALDIEWLANRDEDLMGYHIYREELIDSVPSITRVNKKLIPATKTNYTDMEIARDVEYLYFIKAIDSVGNLSLPSDKYPAKVIGEKEVPKIALNNIETKINIENGEVLISWQYQNKDDTKGVVVFRKSQEERLRPVSGLIRDKKYIDKTMETNVDYIYLLISYSHEGNKWTSSEYNAIIKED